MTGQVVVVRHGETEWSRSGQHTGLTDLPLTAHGEEQARALGPRLAGHTFAAVLSSPLQRAMRTAKLAGLTSTVDYDLREWEYGALEGVTTADWQREHSGWNLWRDGAPGGEDADAVGARADAVLGRVRPLLSRGDVALVAHGHLLRVLTARWLSLAACGGELFVLDPASVTLLGHEHGTPVLRGLND